MCFVACIAADSTSIPCLFRSLSFCLQLFPLFLKLGGGSGPECGPGLLHLGQRGLYSLLRPGQSILCVLIGHLTELAGAILRVGNDLRAFSLAA